jgi:pyruvate dehydrogenase (quinone)
MAFAVRGPVVIDIHADASIPPLPPHVTLKQARDYLTALAKRDPDALKVIKASVKQMFA